MKERQQNSTAHPIEFLMVLASDHLTGATGLTPTVTLSKNGAAFSAADGAVTEIGSGWYSLAGDADDRSTLGDLLLHVTAVTADPFDDRYTIVNYDPFGSTASPAPAVTNILAGQGQYTFADARDMLVDFAGPSDASGSKLRECRRACIEALRELVNIHDWFYFDKLGRISVVGTYSTGTISYTNSSRTVALSGGTFPAWAGAGCLLIGTTIYDVSSRTSATALVLDSVLNPGADVAAGTTYTLFQEAYPFPSDFIQMQNLRSNANMRTLQGLDQRSYLDARRTLLTPAQPLRFSIMGDPRTRGRNVIRFNPPPSTAETFDYLYRRRERALRTLDYSTGTVSVTGSAVTGTGTTFDTTYHIGATIRFGTSTTVPTGLEGLHPYVEEKTIVAVGGSGSLTLDSDVTNSLSWVKYMISDPIDVDFSMLNAFKACARKTLANNLRMENRQDVQAHWFSELKLAMCADSKYDDQPTATGAGHGGFGRLTLADISSVP